MTEASDVVILFIYLFTYVTFYFIVFYYTIFQQIVDSLQAEDNLVNTTFIINGVMMPSLDLRHNLTKYSENEPALVSLITNDSHSSTLTYLKAFFLYQDFKVFYAVKAVY